MTNGDTAFMMAASVIPTRREVSIDSLGRGHHRGSRIGLRSWPRAGAVGSGRRLTPGAPETFLAAVGEAVRVSGRRVFAWRWAVAGVDEFRRVR